jgi:hypothetical protein
LAHRPKQPYAAGEENPMPIDRYRGPERRVHRMYVTRNTEYHFRGERCVAVRDRRTGSWLDSHLAIDRRLAGAVRFHENGAAIPSPEAPKIGEALYFDEDGRELITSVLASIERPARDVVAGYSS